MNVGVVTDFYFPWIGGPSTAIANISRGLSERGHEVNILAPSPAGPKVEEQDGAVAVTRAATVPFPVGYRLRVARSPVTAVSRWLDRRDTDVLHVHHPFPLSAAAILVARRRGIPVLATNHTIPACSLWGIKESPLIHGPAARGLGAWIRFLLDRCSYVATPTVYAAGELARLGFRAPITVISNGIDTGRFRPGPRPEALSKQLGLDAIPTVLYTGRLDAEKQMDVWLEAAAMLSRKQEVQFVIGGEGTDRVRLERLAVELGLRNRAHFIGYVAGEALPDLYRLADVYCITSPVELQSITTLEAIASGLPAVAVDAGALSELIHDGVNGRLAPAGSPKEIAQALADVLDDGGGSEQRRRASREIALRHNLQTTVGQYEHLLQQAIADRNRGNAAA